MKKLLFSLVLLAAAFSGYCQNMTTTAVVEFDVKGNVNIKDAGIIMAEWMSSAASKTGKFDLYERILLKKVLEEQQLGLTGIISEDTAAKVGELFGVEAIISGTFIEFEGIYTIYARLIDISTGRILKSADVETQDRSALASLVDKMAMVLAGTMSQEALDREGLIVSGNRSIQVPFSIIKVFEKNGQLIAAINRGFEDGITENVGFYIYMPKYEESQVTGQKTIVGKSKIGELTITQVEPNMSSGIMYVSAVYARDPGAIEREGIAVPYFVRNGLGVGATNLGVHAAWLYSAPKWYHYLEFGYTFPMGDLGDCFYVSGGVLYTLFGTNNSQVNFKIGGSYLTYWAELEGEYDEWGYWESTGIEVLGVTPLVEVGLFRYGYIRGGALLGYDIWNYAFVAIPVIQAGVNVYF